MMQRTSLGTSLVPFALTVCGISELPGHCDRRVSHVLSILDPGFPDPEAFGAYAAHERLQLRFYDIIDEQPDMLAPQKEHVESLLAFGRDLLHEAGAAAHLLVHCHAGVSRSTAAMTLLLAQARPDRPAAEALANVQRDLVAKGLGLKVFDCYRPARAVAHFVRWARAIDDVKMKSRFYPGEDKRQLFSRGYLASRSGHSRGSTVDLTVVTLADKAELDMGTPFDFFSARSWPGDRSVSVDAQRNRRTLSDAMRKRGFLPHSKEWWHFTLRREPFPDTYFDFAVR